MDVSFASLLMLISAITHAAIGVTLKRSDDKLAFRAVLAVTTALIVLPAAFFVPVPPPSIWPFLILGAALHFIYQLSQISAFDRGDMSLVYPIMRGLSPALAAIIAFIALDERMAPTAIAGLMLSVTALIAFSWPARVRPKGFGSAIGFAVLCGVMIALYSVVDGAGMRAARTQTGQVWGYMVWFFLLDCVLLTPLAIFRRRRTLKSTIKSQLRWGAAAGLTSLVTFGFALYAFSLAPIGQMSALRETSVVFGAIFATLFLKEPFGLRRIGLATLLAIGLIMMQMQ